MTNYFAYGSNLVTQQLCERCPSFAARPVVVGRAVLPAYRLVYPILSGGDWGGGVAGIVPGGADDAVHGVIFELDDAAMAALDDYEGVDEGRYRRAGVTVTRDDGSPCDCVTYLADDDPDGPYLPSQRYLDAILAGAREHGLDAEYIAALARHPVRTA